MSGNIFPVKAWAYASALRAIKERIEAHNRECMGKTALDEADGRFRMVLSSPEVLREVRAELNRVDIRVRLAIPKDAPSFGKMGMPTLEIYSMDGSPVGAPVPLPNLESAIANAIQVELLHFLLKERGQDIPML
ncbi:hypothetical protein [Burkholderia cenocepacia]|uniref:hypothetical protein n=1 Tax=Burkholderia cenocepacia TaxID=95486 RepID=UPI000AA51541|nr:hypothetical protein [Burkholderia cenocepacia]